MNNPIKKSMSYALMAMAMGAATGGIFGSPGPREREKPLKKCLLKSCGKEHTHNGGFCCAEHCREWNETERKNRGTVQN